jgi:hypothetical protein
MKGNIYSLSSQVIEKLEKNMEDFLKCSLARSILIVDRSGCVLSSAGTFSSMKPKDLGVIAAATFTALNKMVDMSNSNELSIRFHSSNLDKIYFAELSDRLIVSILYNCETTGSAIRKCATEFISTMRKMLVDKPEVQSELKDFPSSIEKDLDNLFGCQGTEKQKRK